MEIHAYLTYLVISICFTIVVAQFLYASGKPFLLIAFKQHLELATSINKLLVVGFYLLNIGFVLLFSIVGSQEEIKTGIHFLKYVCWKVGLAMMFLGAMHFFNLFILMMVSASQRKVMPPPIMPSS